MKMDAVITKILAREILDSRGFPTLEVDVRLSNGKCGRYAVPSGASTGKHEALELRDGDTSRFSGKGLLQAISYVEGDLADAVIGQNVADQRQIDHLMCALDGTKQKEKFGANSLLGISMAVADAAAQSSQVDLFQYLGGIRATKIPVPMVNIINGGAHADNAIDIQEFMILPLLFSNFHEALRACTEVFMSLRALLKQKGLSVNNGDEGGFAPDLRSNQEALDFIMQATETAGYSMGRDMYLGLDVAASELMEGENYRLRSEGKIFSREQMIAYLVGLVGNYPILSLEDGMGEDDEAGWQALTKEIGRDAVLIGDDAFVTSTDRLKKAIEKGIGNGILVKPNQVGTLSEVIDVIDQAVHVGYDVVMSHRSGETEYSHIADYAVGLCCDGIKTGSVARSERLAKYNRLIRIEETLGAQARYAGPEWLEKINRRKKNV